MMRWLSAWMSGWLGGLHKEDLRHAAVMSAISALGMGLFPAVAAAQALNVNLGDGAGLTDRVVQ
ncbi:MAG TPA: hypothetical protein VMU59_11645, partial [Caulobacteraceae bacterium]|nr:hypothetical protein [Caulobacteraceae bacterium]